MKFSMIALFALIGLSAATAVQRATYSIKPTVNATWNRGSDGNAEVSPYVFANVTCADICKLSSASSSACEACTTAVSAGAVVECTECWAVAKVSSIDFTISTSPSISIVGTLEVEISELALDVDVGSEFSKTISLATVPIYSTTILGQTVSVSAALSAVVDITKADGPANFKIAFSKIVSFTGTVSKNSTWTITQADGGVSPAVSAYAAGDFEATVGIRADLTLDLASLISGSAYLQPGVDIQANVSSGTPFAAKKTTYLESSGLHVGNCTKRHHMEFDIDFAMPVGASEGGSDIATPTIAPDTLASGCLLPLTASEAAQLSSAAADVDPTVIVDSNGNPTNGAAILAAGFLSAFAVMASL